MLQLQKERYTDLLESEAIPASVTDLREQYTDLSGSQAVPTAVKGGVLDTYSCEKKGILLVGKSGYT